MRAKKKKKKKKGKHVGGIFRASSCLCCVVLSPTLKGSVHTRGGLVRGTTSGTASRNDYVLN